MRRHAILWMLATCSLAAQSLDTLATNYRKTPNPKTRAAVLRYAETHPADKNGALALLVLSSTEIDQRQFGDALQHLKGVEKRLPQLADYVAYLSAVCQAELQEFAQTEKIIAPVWQIAPASPLVSRSVALQVDSYLHANQAKSAISLVQQHLADLAEPQAELLLARAYDADGNAGAAAAHYQKIYTDFPLSKEASDAETALARYPAVETKALLARGLKLEEGGDYNRARKELTALLPRLNGAELDLARVRIGAARYLARESAPAYEYLNSFQVATPDAEAERVYYLLESARRTDHIDAMRAALDKLTQAFPHSPWRLQALITTANYYSSHNQAPASEPFYHTCYESFPDSPQTQQCHWKIAWAEYLRGPAQAASMLEDHLKRYPDSDHGSTALYFLGRIAEEKSNWGVARAYYEELSASYPNYYYAMLAREKLRQPSIANVSAAALTVQFLGSTQIAKRRRNENFVASAVTRQRSERAHLLASAGLDDMAEDELRYGAKLDGQPHLMAVELAELASQRDAPELGIRYIKRFVPGYMSLSIDSAPQKFWRLAFPLPYRQALEQYCNEHSLDPFLVAALIRQESEFNTKAVSRANARGLTQVMPATGRELSRKLKIPRYTTAMLFTPATNLQIGTYYLKALYDQLQGQWEPALASYNAGKSRAVSWMASTKYREPAEFVESIPFSETRAYVQSVLRNADVYRRLYGQKTP